MAESTAERFHAALAAAVADVAGRATTFAATLQPALPYTVPSPLDKTPVEPNVVLSRLASIIGMPVHDATTAHASTFALAAHLAAILSDETVITAAATETLTRHVYTATISWLTSLFALWASKVVAFAAHETEMLAAVGHAALAWKYEAFASVGFQGLYSRPPVFYLAEATPESTISALASALLLPTKLIRLVPLQPNSFRMDVAQLEKMVNEDVERGHLPTFLLTRAETPVTGEIDDLLPLRVLCEKHRIWMHMQGAGLGVLPLAKIPTGPFTAAVMADSVAFNPAQWLQLPLAPWVVFFRTVSTASPDGAVREVSSSPSNTVILSPLPTISRLVQPSLSLVMPLWFVLQQQGQTQIVTRLAQAVEQTTALTKALGSCSHLHMTPRMFDAQYVLWRFRTPSDVAPGEFAVHGAGGSLAQLVNLATHKIHDALTSESRALVDLVIVDEMAYLRFRPFRHMAAMSLNHLNKLAQETIEQAAIVDSTLCQQAAFEAACKERKLVLVPVANFFGLGAVRYVPTFVDVDSLSQSAFEDLNDLNVKIAEQLQQEDSRLFSAQKALNNPTWTCIGVGLSTSTLSPEDVEAAVDAILMVAGNTEKSSKFMEDLAAIVKSSIQSAQSALTQQMEMELEDELLRQIPIVGSLYNYFSPEQPKKKASGRYFTLKDGKLGMSQEVIKAGISSPAQPSSPAASPASATNAPPNNTNDTSDSKTPTVGSEQTSNPFEAERIVAIEAVTLACTICDAVFNDLLAVETHVKEDRSPVTVADYAAQAVVLHVLRRAYPNDTIISEEDSQSLRDPASHALAQKVLQLVSQVLDMTLTIDDLFALIDHGKDTKVNDGTGRVWALDPIDGTKGFLRGGQFAVCLALLNEGTPVVAVMGCPNLPIDPTTQDSQRGCLFVAGKRHGAWQRPIYDSEAAFRRIYVAAVSDPANAVLCESIEASHSAHNEVSRVAQQVGIVRPSLRFDSQCKYATVARGESTIYLRLPTDATYAEKIWDHACGWLLVQEAGGQVTDGHGMALNFGQGNTLQGNSGILASNGVLHGRSLLAIAAVLADVHSTPADPQDAI